MILITGATGTIGSALVRHLTERGEQVRAFTRDPARAEALLPSGVEITAGDYDDGDSLKAAFDGAESAFLIGVLGPRYRDRDLPLVAAARAAGVRRVVKLSAIGTGDARLGAVGTRHLPGEEAVRDSGLEWAVLRPSAFASNTLQWAEPIRSGTPVPNFTGGGRQGVVDPRDVAEVAAETLLSARHSGRVLTLTGPEAISAVDQAATLASALGRPVETVEVPADAVFGQLTGAGMEPEYARDVQQGMAFIRAGGNLRLTEEVAEILGRRPRTYGDWVDDHVEAFR
ncbi:NAD(P)H-binding protein [Streptomyces sp. NPDC059009]|uniref:NAD(P)H-binding protein n=1 Tax=Streptomyces sp. NPDC059009 TaxID=3346694 RepID=UPI003695DDEE